MMECPWLLHPINLPYNSKIMQPFAAPHGVRRATAPLQMCNWVLHLIQLHTAYLRHAAYLPSVAPHSTSWIAVYINIKIILSLSLSYQPAILSNRNIWLQKMLFQQYPLCYRFQCHQTKSGVCFSPNICFEELRK